MSRPEKPIDWKRVDLLLMAGCLGTEIASNFDMHPDTLYKRIEQEYGMGFTAYSSSKKQQGDSILRAKQYEKALEKDNTMLIWLGKNRLGQKEHDNTPNILPPTDDILEMRHENMILKAQLAKALDELSNKS